MVKFWSLAAMAAFALAATTSVEAQNAAVHAPELESRAATPAVAPATVPATAPKAAAPAAATTPKAATTPSAAATTPKAAATPAAATTPKAATTPSAATTPKAAATPPAGTTPKAAGTPSGIATPNGRPPALTIDKPIDAAAAAAASAPNSPTWVDNKIKSNPTQNSCYRRVRIANNKACDPNYVFDDLVSCWSRCPLDYPVQCGFECLPQNKDCTLDIVDKASAVATTAASLATSGFFGAVVKAAVGTKKVVACGQAILGVTKKVSAEVDKLSGGKTLTDKDKAKDVISKLDVALYDIPSAVATCLGKKLPANYMSTKTYTKYAEKLIVNVIDKKYENIIPYDPKNFINFYKSFRDFWVKDPSAAADGKLTELTAADMETIGKTVTSCGGALKDYADSVQSAVADYIKKNPTTTADKLEFAIHNLPLVLQELPKATVNCLKNEGGDLVSTREAVVTTAQVLTDQIIKLAKSGTKNTIKTLAQYKLEIAQFGLDLISIFDTTGISDLVKKFLNPICPISSFQGEIQNGPLDKALGLELDGKAFTGSGGTWENQGDGTITLRYKSVDTKDVTLNIISGGKRLETIPVKAGTSGQNSLALSKYAGKTLYVDRWRAGILGLSGTGGGSLLLWVPQSTKGRIVLDVVINPTHTGDR